MNGFSSMVNKYDIWTLAPIQCLPLEEKTKEWVRWNADWFENIALRELPVKSRRLEKLYNLAAGVINKSDYIYDPNSNQMSAHLGIIGETDSEQTLLEQFFPLIPPVMKNFIGEFIKMDKKIIVDAVDPDSISEMLKFKEDLLKKSLIDHAMQIKQVELMKMGIIPTDNMQDEISKQYAQEMQSTQDIASVEAKFKKFRTKAALWGQSFIEKFKASNYFDELELQLYIDSLVADEVIMGFELKDEDFTPYRMEPKKTYVNIAPSKTYYSDANFVVNIDFMSIPEIINTFRNKLTDIQIVDLEKSYNEVYTSNILMGTDSNGPFGSGYYDTTKSYSENQKYGANITEAESNFKLESFLHEAIGGKDNTFNYSNYFNNAKMIRVSRIWWSSQQRIGILYKMIDGVLDEIEKVDENYLITEEPVFDKSLLNEESERTLISGEYIKWTFLPQWRTVTKIGHNVPYHIVNPDKNQLCIYLDGDPIQFQRSGENNKYEAKPNLEGRRISEKNTISVPFIEGLKPWQIVYNVVNNKILKLMPDDIGPILVTNESSLTRNSLHQESGQQPLFEMMDGLREHKVLLNKDLNTGIALNGRTVAPSILNISTLEKMKSYLELGQMVKMSAFESIGVSRERLSNIQASQSATGVQQSIEGSINQTEIYFDIFSNKFIPKVFQAVLDYGQYYTTLKDSFSDTYINSDEDKIFFSILKDELLLKDLHVYAFSKANMRRLMADLKQLMLTDNTMGATFLDKIKGLNSNSPTEIINKLETAERNRQELEKQKQEMDMQKQKDQQEFLAGEQEKISIKEDERFYAKLQNDKEVAEIKSLGYANDTDININSVPDALEIEKFKVLTEQANNNLSLKDRQLRMQEQTNKSNNNFKQQQLNLKAQEIASKERIAIENKNMADIKAENMAKNRTKK